MAHRARPLRAIAPASRGAAGPPWPSSVLAGRPGRGGGPAAGAGADCRPGARPGHRRQGQVRGKRAGRSGAGFPAGAVRPGGDRSGTPEQESARMHRCACSRAADALRTRTAPRPGRSARTTFHRTHLFSKSARIAASCPACAGSPARASWSLRGTLTPLVTMKATRYRTSAAISQGGAERPWPRQASTTARPRRGTAPMNGVRLRSQHRAQRRGPGGRPHDQGRHRAPLLDHSADSGEQPCRLQPLVDGGDRQGRGTAGHGPRAGRRGRRQAYADGLRRRALSPA